MDVKVPGIRGLVSCPQSRQNAEIPAFRVQKIWTRALKQDQRSG